MRVLAGAGHNDILDAAGQAVATEIATWASELES
jgi:hypothetical protein